MKIEAILNIPIPSTRDQDKINKIRLRGHCRVTKVEFKKLRFLIPVTTGTIYFYVYYLNPSKAL